MDGSRELEVWRGLSTVYQDITRELEDALNSRYRLCMSGLEILQVLAESSSWIRLREVTVRVSRSQPQVSKLVAKLAERGLAERSTVNADARGFQVRITDAGHAVHTAATGIFHEVLRARLLDHLSEEQVHLLSALAESSSSGVVAQASA